jgi:YHS domain-containing protein
MTVAAGQGFEATHEGRTVRFCSKGCLSAFQADPQRFAQPKAGDPAPKTGHGCCG